MSPAIGKELQICKLRKFRDILPVSDGYNGGFENAQGETISMPTVTFFPRAVYCLHPDSLFLQLKHPGFLCQIWISCFSYYDVASRRNQTKIENKFYSFQFLPIKRGNCPYTVKGSPKRSF
jgi:hypothetical protein